MRRRSKRSVELAHRFLYVDNDADRLLYRARFMIVLLGIVLGAAVFLWALEWLGWRAALVALVLYATERTSRPTRNLSRRISV